MGLLHTVVVSTLPLIPRPIMRRLSARYIAGETLEEALTVLRANQAAGFAGVLDILGEDVADEQAARAAQGQYKAAATAQGQAGVDSYVSIKPTHFGLRLSKRLAHELYDDLLTHCASLGQFARIEMEDASTTDDTLALFKSLRAKHDNVGIVLQSRLKRTLHDIEELSEVPCDVRMVKGIYLEPARIAHTEANQIRDAFVACSVALFQRGHRICFATHDGDLAGRLLREALDKGVDRGRYEFEVLLGVREELWKRWLDAGNKVRVYVPYGPEWRSYSQRRLRKNPEVLSHLMRNLLRR
ncbi:MAG: proline dehydrogenase family protein [Planctomycetota bacterium]|nr:proline dehydrogenase family protein [Planctomycetota bacterium]